MYLLPQEVEVWYIIPKIRKDLSVLFVKKYELSYEKVGAILGISKAAVCQYLSNKRANKITLSNEIKKEIEKSAKLIMDKKSNGVMEIERILGRMRATKSSCDVCKKYNKEVLAYCNCEPKY